MRQLIPFSIFVVLIIFFAIGLTKDPRLIPSPLVGEPLPVRQLDELRSAGSPLLTNNLGGSNFILNVWASWCAACLEEHHLLMELATRNAIPIVGLNYKDTRKDASNWLDKNGNPYLQTWFDPDGEFGMELGVYGVPETFFVDKTGTIRHKHIGPLDRSNITKAIDLLNAEQNSPL